MGIKEGKREVSELKLEDLVGIVYTNVPVER